MRWQKPARLAIATFVIVFGAVVFITLRRPAPTRIQESTPREDAKTIAETHGAAGKPLPLFERFGPDGKPLIRIAYEKQLTYADGRTVFANSTMTLPDRDGRTVTIFGVESEIVVPQNEAGPLSTVKITRGVKLRTSDDLEVTSSDATYDEKTGMLNVPGEVQFRKGRMSGSGIGATYDRDRQVIWLLARAQMTIEPDGKDGSPVEATAGSAGLARAEHYVRLTKNAHVVGDGRTLDADDITIDLSEDDRRIESMALRGNSRITGAPGSGGAEGMSARDIDLTYAPDGRTLQQARLVENAVAQLAGGAGTAAKKITARTIDITMADDGSTVTGLNASSNVRLDLPATADAPAREIEAPELAAGGAKGIETATFTGGVTYRELRPATRGSAAGKRTGSSRRLVVKTQPGLGAIQEADFIGNVSIVDGATTGEGQRAVYHVAQDRFDLMPATGEPGPTAAVNDGRIQVNAVRISFTIGSRNLSADTAVRSSLQTAKRDAPGRQGGAGEGAKLPSMFKEGEVVYVTSNRLEYDGAAGLATYTGDSRLWQDKTTIKGETIVVDDRSGNLTAAGRVQTVMFFEELDAATKTTQLVQMDASGDKMVYQEGKRVATYTTGPTAKAHIVGSQGDVVAEQIQLFLKPSINELDRAEADSQVVVKEGIRTATGQHLTYTPANDTYVMDGSPVEIEERSPTECRITVASRLTFKRSVVTTTIQNDGLTPSRIKPCPPK